MPAEAPVRPDHTSRELEALIEEARRRARRRRFGYAAGAVALVLGIAAVLLSRGGEEAGQPPDAGNARSSAAGEQSDVLFARAIVDSREGLFKVDLTTGEVTRLRLRMSCGDTPFCLISTGGELVISSVGRTTAYNPAAGGRPRAGRLGNGWITVPSTHDGRLWLGILARGKLGGPHRRGLSAMREIDLEDNVVRRMRPPEGEWPVGAVASGLLFQSGSGLRLWNLEEHGFTLRIPGAYPADTSERLVASCGDGCPKAALTDTRTGNTTRIAPPSGYRWVGGYDGAFSPDGSHLALPIAPAGKPADSSGRVAVVDTRTRDARVIPGSVETDPVYRAMTWSSDGDRLYFARDDGAVMSYSVGSDDLSTHASVDSDDVILQMVSVSPRD
jgi:hypothetical protein